MKLPSCSVPAAKDEKPPGICEASPALCAIFGLQGAHKLYFIFLAGEKGAAWSYLTLNTCWQ